MYPKGNSFVYSEIRNFTIALKRPFVFLQRNAKFWNCTQTVISLFCSETKNFKTAPKWPFVFLQRNTEFWKLHPNGHLHFPQQNTKSNYYFCFLKSRKKIKNIISWYFVSFFLRWKTKLETLLNSEIHIIYERVKTL